MDQLPIDLIFRLGLNLDYLEVLNLSATCQSLVKVFGDAEFWRSKITLDWEISSDMYNKWLLRKKCPRLTYLSLTAYHIASQVTPPTGGSLIIHRIDKTFNPRFLAAHFMGYGLVDNIYRINGVYIVTYYDGNKVSSFMKNYVGRYSGFRFDTPYLPIKNQSL